MISVTDASGRYIYVNDHYCQQSGYTREELLKMDTRSLTHKKMPKQVLSELSATLAKGFSWQGVLRIENKDKQDVWLDTFITPQY